MEVCRFCGDRVQYVRRGAFGSWKTFGTTNGFTCAGTSRPHGIERKR